MAEILKSTDFNFGNLRALFLQLADYWRTQLNFWRALAYIKALADNNFKILNLANHALDQGLKGLDLLYLFWIN